MRAGGEGNASQDGRGGLAALREDALTDYLAIHQNVCLRSRGIHAVGRDGQIKATVRGGQDAVGEGITDRNLCHLYASRRGNGGMALDVLGDGDVASLVGYGLVLIRAAAATHRSRTSDEPEGSGGGLGHVANGTARQRTIRDGADRVIVHVEGVIVAPPLDLKGLEAIEAGVLIEGANGVHLGAGGLTVYGDLNDHLLLSGREVACAEILGVGIGEDRAGLSALGDGGDVVLSGEIPRKGRFGDQHTVRRQGKPRSRCQRTGE